MNRKISMYYSYPQFDMQSYPLRKYSHMFWKYLLNLKIESLINICFMIWWADVAIQLTLSANEIFCRPVSLSVTIVTSTYFSLLLISKICKWVHHDLKSQNIDNSLKYTQILLICLYQTIVIFPSNALILYYFFCVNF